MKDDLIPENLPKQAQPQQDLREELQRETQAAEFSMTEDEALRAMEFFRNEQNLLVGIVAGFLAAVAGAAVWAGITVATEYQIGWMAVGIGFLVGLAVRAGGKGIDKIFGLVGAAMALLGCALGNLFTVAYFVARETGVAVTEVLAGLDLEMAFEMLAATLQVTDILFYGLAMYFGYRYSFRQLSMADFNEALGRAM